MCFIYLCTRAETESYIEYSYSNSIKNSFANKLKFEILKSQCLKYNPNCLCEFKSVWLITYTKLQWVEKANQQMNIFCCRCSYN